MFVKLIFPQNITNMIIEFDIFLLTLAMFALGVETNFNKIKELGLKPVLLALIMFIWLVSAGMLVSKIL